MLGNNIKEQDVYNQLRIIWAKRMSILKSCIIAFVLAIVIGFCIPKTYQSTVVLAPESAKSSAISSLSSFASLAGVDLSAMQSEDAIYPELYPQIVSSTSFIEDLYSMNVTSADGEINTTLYKYVLSHQEKAWWSYVLDFPSHVKKWFVKPDAPLVISGEGSAEAKEIEFKAYTKEQTTVMNRIKKMVQCTVDVGNNVITITVEMQDPLISAQVANQVATLLQNKVIEYRTSKYVKDYEYSQAIYEEAKNNYYEKQSEFADYLDRHALGTTMARYRTGGDRLEDEMTLAYTLYCQLAQQKELARAKVQERTPVFTVIQPALVPSLPFGPRKLFIAVAFVFLNLFGHITYIVLSKKMKRIFRFRKNKE